MRLSLVIPVYNAMPYLRELLDSIAAQTMPARDYEVICVNDGSTDDSGELLDQFAAAHDNVTVIHQDNWGWPCQPRNRGVDQAQGRYVFFADADDVFTPQAFVSMCDFADEVGADMVLPQLGSLNGRWVQTHLFKATQIDADIEAVMKTLGPTKLFRRSFLTQHGLRFPEDKVRLEDGIMCAKAYLVAKRVSVLAGEDLYLVRTRDDGQNISYRVSDPIGYTEAIARVNRNIRRYDVDTARANRVILDLYRRKCLKFYKPERFSKMSEDRAQKFLQAHQKLQSEFIPVELENQLDEPFLSRSRLVRVGDMVAMRIATQYGLVDLNPELSHLELGGGGLVLHINAYGNSTKEAPDEMYLDLCHRGKTSQRKCLKPEHREWSEGETNSICRLNFRVGWKTLLSFRTGIIDSYLVRRIPLEGCGDHSYTQRQRVAIAENEARGLKQMKAVEPFRTVRGNFSIKVHVSTIQSQIRRMKNVLKRLRKRLSQLCSTK